MGEGYGLGVWGGSMEMGMERRMEGVWGRDPRRLASPLAHIHPFAPARPRQLASPIRAGDRPRRLAPPPLAPQHPLTCLPLLAPVRLRQPGPPARAGPHPRRGLPFTKCPRRLARSHARASALAQPAPLTRATRARARGPAPTRRRSPPLA
ncbi:max-binding protein MNT-like [Ananas comosus]|uniref:Max-binding protein MNT-like n=1 Tax=Ananas comosus TaxID=4615 RepID=A0A6P5GZK3_ANACO|nr:max-binding protein MNT-like [Ananas comosus]